jgi:hypothetical protein
LTIFDITSQRKAAAPAGRSVSLSPSPNGFTCSLQILLSDAAATICAWACALFLRASTSSFYRIENEDVAILHVFHGSRDIEAFLRH